MGNEHLFAWRFNEVQFQGLRLQPEGGRRGSMDAEWMRRGRGRQVVNFQFLISEFPGQSGLWFATWTIFLGILLLLTGCGPQSSSPSQPDHLPVVPFPATGAYTGAYIEFGKTEDHVTLDAIEDFEALVGKHQTIIAFSSFWGEESFPTKSLHIVSRHGALPLILWSPWDRPYVEERGPDRFRLDMIESGWWDTYIEAWADAAKAHPGPILVSWGLEMNGSWFPWSGFYYGGQESAGAPGDIAGAAAGPEQFKRAFRHVVEVVRARGAHNILWGFHCNNFNYPLEDWNTMAAYFPGRQYVDWLGLSVYGMQFSKDPWVSFSEAMDSAYAEITRIDPQLPVVVAEWGVAEFPRKGSKAGWIREGLEAFKSRYVRVKAAVYWHERWLNSDESYSNLRVNSSPDSLDAYRTGVSDPHWLGQLQHAATSGAVR